MSQSLQFDAARPEMASVCAHTRLVILGRENLLATPELTEIWSNYAVKL